MKKQIFWCFCIALLLFSRAFAKNYRSKHFAIYSDLDPCYVQLVQANVEAYYKNLHEQYFPLGWREPLIIYYSKSQSDTQRLLKRNGLKAEVEYGFYDPNVPAVYTHQFMDDGESNCRGTLFHEIAHRFIHLNYHDCPAWFDEGFACFLGAHTQIVRGKLIAGRPNPWREKILRSKIEGDRRPNIKRLFSSSRERFQEWDLGCHFARELFCWLHETDRLKQYLENVREKGYELSVLEETVSDSYGRINIGLLKYIRKNCYAGAYLEDGRETDDREQKMQACLKALELKPDYQTARLELADCFYRSGDYENCRQKLKEILEGPECFEFQQAASLMANTYYDQKDYSSALEYYKKAWKYSDYYEYKHRLAYQIGNCFYYLKDPDNTICWYKKFLNCNWEQESMKASVDYAREYIKRTETPVSVRYGEYERNTQGHSR